MVDNAHNHGFAQIVARPTRITEHSATLIDHVFTNKLDSALSCNIITLDISNHLAIQTKISLDSTSLTPRLNAQKQKCTKNEFRIMNEANHEFFKT